MANVDRLSAEQVMRVARMRFITLSSQHSVDLSILKHIFCSEEFGLSNGDAKDAELALLLLASAHSFANQQVHLASKFLNLCDFLSSRTGSSVQRIVYYFTKALRERIKRETGVVTVKEERPVLHPYETTVSSNPALIPCSLKLPHIQVTQFSAIQAILEGLGSAKRVHFIDLDIRCGEHCTALMQALVNRQECAIESLKITAVGTTAEHRIEETGKRLACFAETLDIPFSFKVVMVGNIKDLREHMFELSEGEAVSIYFRTVLRNIKAQPDCLDSLMRVLKKLNPCVMVIIELEANHNSPTFTDRFVDALFFFSAYFDCLQVCTKASDPGRMLFEGCLGREIKDIVAAEDDERMFRHMKIDEWRAYFMRFGMEETELSMSSFYQAELVLKNYVYGNVCTLDRNGKCLIIGWKGTPFLSVSSWKFRCQEQYKRSSTKKSKNTLTQVVEM